MSENMDKDGKGQDKDGPQPPFTVGLSYALAEMLADDRITQAFLVVMTEDDEIVRTKGHFYDNATLLNSVLGDFREKVYLDIFSGPKPRTEFSPRKS